MSSRPVPAAGLSPWLVLLIAASCGLIAANLYYAQPLIGLISPDIGLDARAASLIVTLTQLGYCAGLVLLVPLGDVLENRRLVLMTMGGGVVALLLAAWAPSAAWFLVASLFIGIGSVAVQMLVPIAAHITPDAVRGRVVGNVMSGLLLGIMLARPVSGLLAGTFGWRGVFVVSTGVMLVLAVVLWRCLPKRQPEADHGYGELLVSMAALLRDTPLLRRRAAYQALMFAAFSLYWTTVPLLLASPAFGLDAHGIALFALAGAAGTIAAPVAGRLADQGHTRVASGVAIASVAIGFALAWAGGSIGSIALLLAGGILIDLGVQANLVLGQRVIYSLGTHTRSRMNGLYMAIFFFGGAVGSAVASVSFAQGWTTVALLGIAFPLVALALYGSGRRG